jgi:hypothetical protein
MRQSIAERGVEKKNGPISFEEAVSNQKADKICAMQFYIPALNLK